MDGWGNLCHVAPNIKQEQWTELPKKQILTQEICLLSQWKYSTEDKTALSIIGSTLPGGPEGKAVREAIMTLGVPISSAHVSPVFLGLLMQHTVQSVWEKEPGASKLYFPNDKNLQGGGCPSPPSAASEEEPGKLLVLQVPSGDFCHHGCWRNTSQT